MSHGSYGLIIGLYSAGHGKQADHGTEYKRTGFDIDFNMYSSAWFGAVRKMDGVSGVPREWT